MLPNLVAPILVYTTLLIPTNILFEAALSFLGVGIQAADGDLGRHGVAGGAVLHAAATSCSGPAWRSSSPCWPSTCSATDCATPSIRRVASPGQTSGPGHNPSPTTKGRVMRKRLVTTVAIAAVIALGAGRVQLQVDDDDTGHRLQHDGRVQRGPGQGVQPFRQEGRHHQAGQRRRLGHPGPGRDLLRVLLELPAPLRPVPGDLQAGPGQRQQRAGARPGRDAGRAERRRQDLDLQDPQGRQVRGRHHGHVEGRQVRGPALDRQGDLPERAGLLRAVPEPAGRVQGSVQVAGR